MNKVFLIIGMSFILLFVGFSAVDIGEANDVIYACKHKDEGMVRIVDDHSYCRPSEVPVSWQSTPPVPCPCWTLEELNEQYDSMIDFDVTEDPVCVIYDVSEDRPWVPGIMHERRVELSGEFEVNFANAGVQTDRDGGRPWTICEATKGIGPGTVFTLYDMGLNRREILSCSEILFNSKWWQNHCAD